MVVTCGDAAPIALDAGTGLRLWGETLDQAEALRASVLVTHLHLDHIQGIPFFTPLFRSGCRLDIYGPIQEVGSLEKAMTRIFRPPLHPVRPAEIQGEICFHEVRDDHLSIGDASIKVCPVPHLGPTVGYRIEHAGAALAYVSDHQAPHDLEGVDEKVLELVSGVDLLIHDGQYTPADWAAKSDWGHSTVAYAQRVAAVAGVTTLALFHHDARRTDDEVDRIVAAAQATAAVDGGCAVVGAREGLTIELPARSPAKARVTGS